MRYNVKITEYADNIQVSYYEKKITRGDDNDKVIDENDKYSIGDSLQKSWYNTKTGKMEIVPCGFRVEIDPFTGVEVLCQVKSDEEAEAEHIRNVFRSMRRTKQNVYEIARGSKWDLFVTLTIADEDIRYDLDACKKRVSKRINKIKERYASNLKYLIIFERHPTSGAWHVHGLIKDIEGLTLTKAYNPHTGELIIKNGLRVYNIKEFDVLGFSTATYVEDNNRVTQYILKYISKDMSFEYPGKKSYLCSKGLPRGEEILLECESENEINDALVKYMGYLPQKTHARMCYNIYNDSNILYMQYRKDNDNEVKGCKG